MTPQEKEAFLLRPDVKKLLDEIKGASTEEKALATAVFSIQAACLYYKHIDKDLQTDLVMAIAETFEAMVIADTCYRLMAHPVGSTKLSLAILKEFDKAFAAAKTLRKQLSNLMHLASEQWEKSRNEHDPHQ